MVVVDIIPVDVGDVDVIVDVSVIIDVVVVIGVEIAVVPGLELNVKFALNPLLASMPSVSKTIVRLLPEV